MIVKIRCPFFLCPRSGKPFNTIPTQASKNFYMVHLFLFPSTKTPSTWGEQCTREHALHPFFSKCRLLNVTKTKQSGWGGGDGAIFTAPLQDPLLVGVPADRYQPAAGHTRRMQLTDSAVEENQLPTSTSLVTAVWSSEMRRGVQNKHPRIPEYHTMRDLKRARVFRGTNLVFSY